ncbi:MAG TPA: hypothetical protein PLY52_04095 [Methanothrix sp.]|jgi:hypothetical protein|uniref:hypothetical protein n=1 Tax=Methanothrix sp. TaxID=90426 RepID=UPI002CDE5CFD|nr:hypothetical protein [Methanothrix sp.]MDI9416626.1 hypothetical protein [Euryarchaeota archaeon]HON35477.1 hypothetical protein [Methanothrix sp.]HRU74538.1 hypothetical protein [Methanothrix sp.]
MAKNIIVLLLTALLAATCMSASAVSQEALRPGQAISLTAIDQEAQDGVSYDYLWTVVEVDEDGNEIGDDLVSTGVLSQTGSNTGSFAFLTPVIPKGQHKKFIIKARLTPKKGQNGVGLTICIGETSQEIRVDGPSDSAIGEDLIVCEDNSNVEVELDESIGDNGLDLQWSVDDEAPGSRNHPEKGKRFASIDATELSIGEHIVKLKLKNNSGKGDETEVIKRIHVIHRPKPIIQ